MTAVQPPHLRLVPTVADRKAKPCSVPGDDHEGPVRLFPCGLRCARHAPGPAITPASRTGAA